MLWVNLVNLDIWDMLAYEKVKVKIYKLSFFMQFWSNIKQSKFVFDNLLCSNAEKIHENANKVK